MNLFISFCNTLKLVFVSSILLSATAIVHAQESKPVVFLIFLENHNWLGSGGIAGNPEAPYINKSLLPVAAVANNYFNPPGNHPSVPNYLWLEAGRNFGIHADGPPSQYHQSTHAHLSELLRDAVYPGAHMTNRYPVLCVLSYRKGPLITSVARYISRATHRKSTSTI